MWKKPQEEWPPPLNAPTVAGLRDAQQADAFCSYAARLIETNLRFTVDGQELICRKAPIDVVLLAIVLKRLRRAVIYFGLHPIWAGYPGTGRMYDGVKNDFVGHTKQQMYTATWSSMCHVAGTSFPTDIKDGFSYPNRADRSSLLRLTFLDP